MRIESRSRIKEFFSRFGSQDKKVQDEPLKIDLKSSPELVERLQKRHFTDEERYRVAFKFYLEKSRYEIKENAIWGESPFLYDKKTGEVARDERDKPIKFHLSWTPKLTDKGIISPQKEPSMLKFLEGEYVKDHRTDKKIAPELPSGLTREANDTLRKIDKEGMPGLMPSNWFRMFRDNGISDDDIYRNTLGGLIEMLRNKAPEKAADTVVVADTVIVKEQEKEMPDPTESEPLAAKKAHDRAHQDSIQVYTLYLKLLEANGAYNSAAEASSEAYATYWKAFEESGEMEEITFKGTVEGRDLLEKFRKSLEIKNEAAEAFRSSTPRGQELYGKWWGMKKIENKIGEALTDEQRLVPLPSR
jgi:hypothetical protein